MTLPKDAMSRAGHILYRELPEEYRYRDQPTGDGDPAELGDLALYMHGFGHMLDLIRATTEQAHADSFAEPLADGREIQPWLLPYLAELLGAELMAPDPAQRREELNNTVLWAKSKGTLRNIDHVSDVVSGTENVVQEGWRHTLICPRPHLPPFSTPSNEDAGAIGHTAAPLGCPDFRAMDRAVQDLDGSHPLYRLSFDAEADGAAAEVIYWTPRNPGGVPAFPGSFCDGSARCPDLRDPDTTLQPGPHPGRARIHVRPADGMFAQGIPTWVLNRNQRLNLKSGPILTPAYLHEVLRKGDDVAVPEVLRLALKTDIVVPAGTTIQMHNIRVVGQDGARIRLVLRKGARAILRNCAIEAVVCEGSGDGPEDITPTLEAQDCLFGSVLAINHFARMVYCTVMGMTDLARLQASDCLFGEISSNLKCENDASCIRYSRFDAFEGAEGCFSKDAPTNTQIPAHFTRRYAREGDTCVLRVPSYGAAGYGVLDTICDPAITAGAEDAGELGAHHQFFTTARLRALRKKLSAYLPLGQEIALAYDPLLSLRPPKVMP